ncbi:MAG: hypothetical protein A3F16_02240 [Deltaproteobacteria bacterium RIFCSPHIGHO2_12_FULL_43_9]|nr:MAG: hypothetical protein A3F16_02240 [Deltaproteobacteria bacterium RIFCSPHIGHO2_12_FULL_43_9]
MQQLEIRTKLAHPWSAKLQARLQEPKPFIQILLGPRQVGKTTSLLTLVAKWKSGKSVMSSADERQLEGPIWIEQNWSKARQIKEQDGKSDVLLVLDEIQKISNWSETVKRLWDEDVSSQRRLKVVLSGSSSLKIQTGLSESLAGRFEIIPATHGSWNDFKKLTSGTINEYIFFGGYPGALQFIKDEERWRSYITNSIIENVISKDILLLTRVDKPALLRRLFQLGCEYSGQILSFQKAIGFLQDAGNTTTLAHYLDLLNQAYVLAGLQKFEFRKFRLRNSSPKFLVHNTALIGALGGYRFDDAQNNPAVWGRYLESCIGSHLLNYSRVEGFELFYWREGIHEVDYIIRMGSKILAIEVKSSVMGKTSGLKMFLSKANKATGIVIGHSGKELEDFLSHSPSELLK